MTNRPTQPTQSYINRALKTCTPRKSKNSRLATRKCWRNLLQISTPNSGSWIGKPGVNWHNSVEDSSSISNFTETVLPPKVKIDEQKCNQTSHDTIHLFSCPGNPTCLSTESLRTGQLAAADFLELSESEETKRNSTSTNQMPSFDGYTQTRMTAPEQTTNSPELSAWASSFKFYKTSPAWEGTVQGQDETTLNIINNGEWSDESDAVFSEEPVGSRPTVSPPFNDDSTSAVKTTTQPCSTDKKTNWTTEIHLLDHARIKNSNEKTRL